jgi:hypothetical protein
MGRNPKRKARLSAGAAGRAKSGTGGLPVSSFDVVTTPACFKRSQTQNGPQYIRAGRFVRLVILEPSACKAEVLNVDLSRYAVHSAGITSQAH